MGKNDEQEYEQESSASAISLHPMANEICVGCRGGGCAELEQQEEQDGQDSEQELKREAPTVYATAEVGAT